MKNQHIQYLANLASSRAWPILHVCQHFYANWQLRQVGPTTGHKWVCARKPHLNWGSAFVLAAAAAAAETWLTSVFVVGFGTNCAFSLALN